MLDSIAGGSCGECTCSKIAEKLKKISHNNKDRRTGKSYRESNTLAMQATHNPATDKIRQEMAQMRTELGLVLKHVIGV